MINGAFNGLTKVDLIRFHSNPCYFSDMYGGIDIVPEIEAQCKDKFLKRIDDLEEEVQEVKNELAILKRRNRG